MSRVIADGLSKKVTATTQEAEDAVEGKFPDAAGVHAAFNQYGLGADLFGVRLSNPDADTYMTTGEIAYSATWVNGPENVGMLFVHGSTTEDSGRTAQTFISTSNGNMHYRFRANGLWQPWREVFTQFSILGTVSQSAGVPTGAIIERGSNANGEYVKFADGTLECFSPNFSLNASVLVNSGLYRSSSTEINNQRWTFPTAFISSAHVVHGQAKNWFKASIICTDASGASFVDLCLLAVSSSEVLARSDCYVTAKGRWY